jgi:hypothetical protein
MTDYPAPVGACLCCHTCAAVVPIVDMSHHQAWHDDLDDRIERRPPAMWRSPRDEWVKVVEGTVRQYTNGEWGDGWPPGRAWLKDALEGGEITQEQYDSFSGSTEYQQYRQGYEAGWKAAHDDHADEAQDNSPSLFGRVKPHPDEGTYPDAMCSICGRNDHSTAWHRGGRLVEQVWVDPEDDCDADD